MTPKPDSDATTQLITDLLNTEPPRELESRLRERFDAFHALMESQTVTSPPARKTSHRRLLQITGIAAVLMTVLLLAITLSTGRSSQALAQVADAVAKKTWLHAEGTGP